MELKEYHQILLSWLGGMAHHQKLGDSRQAKNKSEVSAETRRGQMRIFSVHSGVKQIQADCKVRKVWWETKGQRATSVYTK